MATSTRSSVQRWASAPTRVTPALVDELRMIVDNRGARSVQSLVADYVARHRLRSYLVDDSKAGWSGGLVERKAS